MISRNEQEFINTIKTMERESFEYIEVIPRKNCTEVLYGDSRPNSLGSYWFDIAKVRMGRANPESAVKVVGDLRKCCDKSRKACESPIRARDLGWE